jgi:hypothetical protein
LNLWPRPPPYAPTFDPGRSPDVRAGPSGRQGKPADWLPDEVAHSVVGDRVSTSFGGAASSVIGAL